MRFSVRISIVLVLLIAASATVATAQAKKDLEYFTGLWRGTFEVPGDGKVVHEIEYTWDSMRRYLKVADRQVTAGGKVKTLDGFLGIDRSTGKLHSHTVNSDGEIVWMSEISREDGAVLFEGSGVGQPWLKMMRERIEILSEDSFVWQMLMPSGDEWNAIFTITYERVATEESGR